MEKSSRLSSGANVNWCLVQILEALKVNATNARHVESSVAAQRSHWLVGLCRNGRSEGENSGNLGRGAPGCHVSILIHPNNSPLPCYHEKGPRVCECRDDVGFLEFLETSWNVLKGNLGKW